jgi:pyruvate/2-oxoglutarate dehydrogenase complex dihydrolipoamide acyltransferase (E2) component
MDTPNGLVVPVIKHVQDKSILQIAADLQRLQEAGASGRLSEQGIRIVAISQCVSTLFIYQNSDPSRYRI